MIQLKMLQQMTMIDLLGI